MSAKAADLGGVYARNTEVSPEKSRQEILATIARYGASAFSYGQDGDRAVVMFRLTNGMMVRLDVVTPPLDDFKHTAGGVWRSSAQRSAAREKAMRQRWRALALYVKAKCEAVHIGLETAEQAWLPYILLPDSTTAGEHMAPQLQHVYETGQMPAALPGVPRPELGEGGA